LIVLGLALLAVLVVGVRMLITREPAANLPRIHVVSAIVMLVAIVATAIAVALKV